ncbi:MAG: hypothetical protein MJ226_00270 [archaeon]|uniref:hypothetical protein n=1 Tax=Methanobrevibacter gottschalkii TaxID=190974 RepID=UPI002A40DCFF|nr:hypothetical protein [archaeon]
MNIYETIKNIRASCDNYVDPNLLAFIIDDDNHMGDNNILEIRGYDIRDNDAYEERLFKIHKNENIFLPCGMITFIPVLNECDIFSTKDYSLKLSPEEFDKYCEQEEKLFGILIKKDSTDYKIGQTDVCNCSITASFKEFRKADGKFYKKIEEIIESKIID